MSRCLHISNFQNKLFLLKDDKNIMANSILSNIKGNYYGFCFTDKELKFLDNLYKAINIKNIDDNKILKELSIYNISNCDISNTLLYILSGGIKYRYEKKNTWLERKKTSLIEYIIKMHNKINIKLYYIFSENVLNFGYHYIPNKNVDFYIDYINLKGYRLLDKLNKI